MLLASFFFALGVSVFPFIISPVGMVAVLVWVGVWVSMAVGLVSSGWYAHVLFLIFIGGVLVLLVYMSLLLSNTEEVLKMVGLVLVLPCMLMCVPYSSMQSSLGNSLWSSSAGLLDGGGSLYLLLVVYLFIMLLGVVVAVRPGSSLSVKAQ